MQELIRECIEQDVWAVVGFSADRRKYGNIVYHDLGRAGYRVHAVHPAGGTVQGVPVYPSVLELPERVGVVNLVVPADVGLQVVEQCARAGLQRVWMQPGAQSSRLIDRCRQLGLKAVYNACAMVEKRRRVRPQASGPDSGI